MIERLSLFRGWQIFWLGVAALLAVLGVITLVAHFCYQLFPNAWGPIAAGHFLAAGLSGWFVPKPFLEAYVLRSFTDSWERVHDAYTKDEL
jgi:hypothetical protein